MTLTGSDAVPAQPAVPNDMTSDKQQTSPQESEASKPNLDADESQTQAASPDSNDQLTPEQLTAKAFATFDDSTADRDAGIELFGLALRTQIEKLGNDLAPECAPYYFNYGDALLQECSQRNSVFGTSLKAAELAEEAVSDEDADGDDDEAAEVEIEDEPEQTDLELAWELLETARIIYTKALSEGSNIEFTLGLADCYSRLGDLAMENDQKNAVDDYREAIKLLDSIEPADEHRIRVGRAQAAARFQLGVWMSINAETAQALEEFRRSRSSLLNCIHILLGEGNGKGEAAVAVSALRERAESFNGDKSVVTQLIEFLQQIDDKIEDLSVAAPIEPEVLTSMVTSALTSEPKAGATSSSNVTNLGTVVGQKRKRQVEDVAEDNKDE